MPNPPAPSSGTVHGPPEASSLFGSLLATLILLAIPVLAYYGVHWAIGEFPLQGTLITVALPGAVGGLLYALRERQIILPRWALLRGGAIDPGVFADLWFGVAGAYVVFLIVPGDLAFAPGASPPASQPSDPALWAFIEITGLALLGGYAARAATANGRVDLRHQVAELQAFRQRIEQSPPVPPAASTAGPALAGAASGERPGASLPSLEFHRAVCNIRLDPSFSARPAQRSAPVIREAILADLQACARDPFTAGLVREEPVVQDWLRLNHALPV